MSALTQVASPDKTELRRKKADLAALEQALAENELLLSTHKGELHLFEKRYNQSVSAKYTELDEVKAEILELAARFFPHQQEFQENAQSAREQANTSAGENGGAPSSPAQDQKFTPSENLRKLFREVAKKIHPDLTTDPKERERRHDLMARLNKAYDEMEEDKIRAILQEWEDGRQSEEVLSVGGQLVRTIRKIAQVRQRLERIRLEIEQLQNSEMFKLKERIEAAEQEGRDIIAEMISEIEEKIATTKAKVRKLALEV
jgi:hypothetical protein